MSSPDSPTNPLGAGIDAEIEIPDWDPASSEQALNSVLGQMDGVKVLSFSEGHVSIEYDPLKITKATIRDSMIKSGCRVGEIKTGPASPVADAVHPED